MADRVRKIDLEIGTVYNGAGVKSAIADQAKLRQELGVGGAGGMGPLTASDQALETAARRQISAMERAADKANVGARLQEKLFGGGQDRPIRLLDFARTPEEQERRNAEAKRLRALRHGPSESDIEEGRYSIIQRMSKGITPEMTGKLKEAKEHAGGLLGILEKFGLTNGPETLAQKLTKVAGRMGAVAGVAAGVLKAASLGVRYLNYRSDVARHEAQGNVEAQLEDEQSANEFKRSVFIVGELAEGIGDRFNLRNYHSDKVAIEESEMARKRQEAAIARKQRDADKMNSARLASRSANFGLESQIAGHLQTPEQQAIINARTQLAILKQSVADLPSTKISEETKAELINRQKIIDLAVEDEARVHKRKMSAIESDTSEILLDLQKDYLTARHVAMAKAIKIELDQTLDMREKLAVGWKSIVKLGATFLEEFSDKQKYLARLGGEGAELILRASGKSYTAERKRIERERDEAMAEEFDPEKREAIRKRAQSELDASEKTDRRERLEETFDYRQKVYDSESNMRERLQRLSGDHYKADKEQLSRQLIDRKNEIDKRLRENIQAHGEREAEYRQRAAKEREDAQSEYAVGAAEMMVRLGMQFRVNPTNQTPLGDQHTLTGTGSQFRQDTGSSEVVGLMKKMLAALERGVVLQSPNLN